MLNKKCLSNERLPATLFSLKSNFSETRKNYYRSSEFRLDIASLLPLDIFYIVTGIFGKAPLLRLPRYLKVNENR